MELTVSMSSLFNILSIVFAIGGSWYLVRYRVVELEKRVNELEGKDRTWLTFMATVTEKLGHIERDIIDIKKKLEIV